MIETTAGGEIEIETETGTVEADTEIETEIEIVTEIIRKKKGGRHVEMRKTERKGGCSPL